MVCNVLCDTSAHYLSYGNRIYPGNYVLSWNVDYYPHESESNLFHYRHSENMDFHISNYSYYACIVEINNMHTIVYYYIDIPTLFKIKNMLPSELHIQRCHIIVIQECV